MDYALHEVYDEGRHLSTAIQRALRHHHADAETTALVRHRMMQAVRYGDIRAGVNGDLDGVHDPQRLVLSDALRQRLTPTELWCYDGPTFVRVNLLKTTVEDALEALAPFRPVFIENVCIRLDAPYGLYRSQAYTLGWVEQQDINSQRASRMVDARPGLRVIDACAGTGGKTMYMSMVMGQKGRIISMDVVPSKLQELRERAQRIGTSIVETRLVDSTKVVKRLYDSADRVLIDAPCTGTGVVRRNPDMLHRIDATAIAELHVKQQDISHRAIRMTKPGGQWTYVVCSVLPEEGPTMVRWLLEREPASELIEERQWSIGEDDGDAFYAAVVRRSTATTVSVTKSDDA